MSYRQQQHGHVGPPPPGGGGRGNLQDGRDGGGGGGDGHRGGGGYKEGQRRSGGDGRGGGGRGGGRQSGGGGGRGGGGGGKDNVWVQTRPELELRGLMVRTNCFLLVSSVPPPPTPSTIPPTIPPVHQYLIQITSLRSQSDEQDRTKRIGFVKSTKPFFILDHDIDGTTTTTITLLEAQLKNRSTILTRRILQQCQLKFGLSLVRIHILCNF
jgi:hypothetical protein